MSATSRTAASEVPARRVAVVGGGWAGCAAAVALADAGAAVTVYEAARTLGGRARALDAHGRRLDNGQHILLGAYADTLGLLRRVGIDARQALLRLPLQMRYPPAGARHAADPQQPWMDFVAPRLPAPLHMLAALLRAKGLERADKLALARFSTSARWMGWQLNDDCSVAELLERFDQTARLVRLMWRPLCLAALNTAPEHASAQVFLAVLRDSLGARRAASDMLLPRLLLDELFPQAARRHVEARGGRVLCGARVEALAQDGALWRVQACAMAAGAQPASAAPSGPLPAAGVAPGAQAGAAAPSAPSTAATYDAVVLATAPWQAAGLLRALPGAAALADRLDAFAYEPISTVYLQYEPALRLPLPFCALLDEPERGAWGQFVFDRGQLDPGQGGLLAVVISGASAAAGLPRAALAEAVARQLAHAFGVAALARPAWHQVISEKRATFACTPALDRPANATGIAGLVLAGDYTASDYPATLESAVRSGLQAARLAGQPSGRQPAQPAGASVAA
ncbi:FAD-dependent oxidoreductase [Massilia forsythiae]|uniref:FAD-dependent oxidoreductase n=1 Tax=Massilia forsythiae TaxID=2728020 RepID=A0A7Z2W0X2_9BURK|nr:hydroxysqualene dehydroxylase HpnE [Massilia forsythiae]QJE02405.1 FAD-dependent oxidoreductase [Massilia forsythiae]